MLNQRIDRSWACVTRLALVVFAGLAAGRRPVSGERQPMTMRSHTVPRSVCYDF